MRLSCPIPSTSSLLSHFFPLLVSSSASSASPQGAHGWTDHLGWLSNPWADNGWHGWVSMSSGCHVFVLQVAPVDVHGGHVKDLPSLLLPLCPLRALSLSLSLSLSSSLTHCLSVCVSCSPSFFFYVMTQESSLLSCGSSSVGITCMAWSVTPPPHVAAQLTPHTLTGKSSTWHVAHSNQPSHRSFLKFVTSSQPCHVCMRGLEESQRDKKTGSHFSPHPHTPDFTDVSASAAWKHFTVVFFCGFQESAVCQQTWRGVMQSLSHQWHHEN